MRTLASIFLFTLLLLESKAQSFTVYNYSIPEGLPSSEVYEIYEDRSGFLWFATDNGVVKFDGSRMEVLHTKDGLTDPVVFSFYEDQKGRLWFRTFSGILSYLENGKIKKYKHNDKLTAYNQNGVFNFIVTTNEKLCFATREFLGSVDSSGNVDVKTVTIEGVYYKSIGSESLLSVSSKDPDVTKLIIDDKVFTINGVKTSYLNRVYRSVIWKNKLYISLNREVYEYDGNNLRKVIASSYPVINLSIDREDNLWVGYMSGGAQKFSTEDFSKPWEPFFLKSKSVTKVFQDHEGGLWFSTLENGVFNVPNLLINHFPLPNTSRIKGATIYNNRVLIGDQTGNIFELNTERKEPALVKSVEGPLLSIFSSKERIWVSNNAEIFVYDTHFNFQRKYPGLANDFFEDNDGNVWSVGALHLVKFDGQGNELVNTTLQFPYRSLHIQDTSIFFANRVGMKISNINMENLHTPADFEDIKITNILKFNDSTILITTIGKGFMLFQPKTETYKVYNTKNSFIADYIYSSLLTDSCLWLGTEKGLLRIRLEDFYSPSLSFNYLTKKSGLMSDKIDFLLESSNSVWAFSDNNYSIIPKNFTKFATSIPRFYLQEVRVNDKIISAADAIELNPDQNNIEISFGFISFNNPNYLLRYKLSPDDPWIHTSNKKILFSFLAPGHYAFELEYSTDNIHWISAKAPFIFNITQPWYSKWYNQASALFALFIFGYLYFRYQQSIYRQKHHFLKIINDHQQKLIQSEIVTLERERNRISKELHDRVGTNLTAIKLTVSQLLQSYKEPLSQDVENQFQLAIREIKEIIYALTPPSLERYGLFTGLKNYIGKLNKSIPIPISLKTFGQEFSNHELNIIVFRVIQELLTNSIKHSRAKNITIHINSFEDLLNVVYEDDGIGFSYDPLQSGLGLDNIESRIHSVSGTLKFDSGDFGISYTIDIPITLNKEAV